MIVCRNPSQSCQSTNISTSLHKKRVKFSLVSLRRLLVAGLCDPSQIVSICLHVQSTPLLLHNLHQSEFFLFLVIHVWLPVMGHPNRLEIATHLATCYGSVHWATLIFLLHRQLHLHLTITLQAVSKQCSSREKIERERAIF